MMHGTRISKDEDHRLFVVLGTVSTSDPLATIGKASTRKIVRRNTEREREGRQP
jgi:hypothetical protein